LTPSASSPVELDSHWQGGGMTVYIKRYSDMQHPTEDRLLEPGETVFHKHFPPPDQDAEDGEA
jgi:hypothetical protein